MTPPPPPPSSLPLLSDSFFGLHVHQPVGNFDRVFEEHTRDVYLPLLTRLAERDCLPLVVHISGPLLEWLEAHDTGYLDLVGRLAADGRIELLLSGMYEPVLAALSHADRVEQIQWMREAVRARFGVDATGLWLTERVWEPDLPSDLAAAGVTYTLVDDRHFLVSGFRRDQLHTHYRTEAGGDPLVLFPIHERLRYLVPFRPVGELEAYFGELHAAGRALAVLADDGEKFGGWPGTREWVYGRGWLDQFLGAIERLRRDGIVELTTCREALGVVPSGGLAYLPSASYREMETWALPAEQARRLIVLEADLGDQRVAGPDGAFVRGGHWHNFFVKYPESNRAHKQTLVLSALARRRGDPPSARRAIGRAQCNDAYWHGIFGGLYLPHLRAAIWRQLAHAEGELRRDEPLDAEVVDLDGDGDAEVWIHSLRFSAVVAPHCGAGVEGYTIFATGRNYADTLTRRPEAYHTPPAPPWPHQTRRGVLPPPLVDSRSRARTGRAGRAGVRCGDPRALSRAPPSGSRDRRGIRVRPVRRDRAVGGGPICLHGRAKPGCDYRRMHRRWSRQAPPVRRGWDGRRDLPLDGGGSGDVRHRALYGGAFTRVSLYRRGSARRGAMDVPDRHRGPVGSGDRADAAG